MTSEAKQICCPNLTAHDAQKRTEMIKTYRCDGLPARHWIAYTPNGRGARWPTARCRSAWWRLVRWVAACGIIAASRAAWASSDCRSATCDGVDLCGVDSTDRVINGQGVISHRRGDRADVVGRSDDVRLITCDERLQFYDGHREMGHLPTQPSLWSTRLP